MLIKSAAAMLVALLPWAAVAQQAAPSLNPHEQYQLLLVDDLLGTADWTGVNTNKPALPVSVWNTPDGRWLAAIALNIPSQPNLPLAPSIGAPIDWRMLDITNVISGGSLYFRLGNDQHVNARITQQMWNNPLNLANRGMECSTASVNPIIATPCLPLENNERADAAYRNLTAQLGVGWTHGMLSFEVNYGQSRFSGSANAPLLETLPQLIIPITAQFDSFSSTFLTTQSHWQLADDRGLDLGASLSRIQLAFPSGPNAIYNQAALSLGLNRGVFSGGITGRLLSPNDAKSNLQHWTSLDLGISWHTPWQGLLTIGTQNLWSSSAPLSSDASHEADPAQTRVPYVQYHQDL